MDVLPPAADSSLQATTGLSWRSRAMAVSFNGVLPPTASNGPPKEYHCGSWKLHGVLGTTSALPAESVMPLLRPTEKVAGRGGLTLGTSVSVLPSLESERVFSARTPATAKLTVVSLTVVAFTG